MKNDESDKGEDEWVFIAIKENNPVSTESASCTNVEKALVARVEEKDEWVIDSGCSHHMIGDKSKFVSLEKYDGVVRFGNNIVGVIRGRG